MLELIGYAGGLLLAFCGIPLLWDVYRSKNPDKVSIPFMMVWLLGEIFTIIFVLEEAPEAPLILNYSLNIILIVTILIFWKRYKDERDNR